MSALATVAAVSAGLSLFNQVVAALHDLELARQKAANETTADLLTKLTEAQAHADSAIAAYMAQCAKIAEAANAATQ